jgi:ferredoxin-nitrite reductase
MSDGAKGFTEAQKQYLSGFTFGADVARAISGLPVISGSLSGENRSSATSLRIGAAPETGDRASVPRGPDAAAREAQDAAVATGQKLCKEESAKRETNGLDVWDQIQKRADAGVFPKGNDVFLTKFHGMFYVAPAQNSYMCRMRLPGGLLRGWQLRGIAEIARERAGGYVDITTRANLQLREIPADQPTEVLMGLRELDITCQGSGADNIRNCTSSPLSGIDPTEWIETLPLAKRMHHYILANRDLYGLPRKFNIAFDGGGSIGSLDDTNDIGFRVARVDESHADADLPSGTYFQLTLGGITGHKDFARPTGVLLKPHECVEVAAAIIRVYVRSGNRTDRNKARLKYVLDDWGFDKFISEVELTLGKSLRRVSNDRLTFPQNENRFAHVGIHPQLQPGRFYVGVVLPVGRMTCDQASGLADIADRYGNGELRLTVWQNVILPHIDGDDLDEVKREIRRLGLGQEATAFRAGLVACTGSAGCKFAAADTKRHAMVIAETLEERLAVQQPINIHLTGCHHSCAQHYIGDIGLLACKVEQGDSTVDGYHIHVGGGWGRNRAIARLIFPSVIWEDCPNLLTMLVGGYLAQREPDEEFAAFAARMSDDQLRALVADHSVV